MAQGIWGSLIYNPALHKTDEWLTIRGTLLNLQPRRGEEGEETDREGDINQVKETCGDARWTNARADGLWISCMTQKWDSNFTEIKEFNP